jgi:hypothetical protein
MITSQKVVADDIELSEAVVVRDHFPGEGAKQSP